jgi:hypothetical protein
VLTRFSIGDVYPVHWIFVELVDTPKKIILNYKTFAMTSSPQIENCDWPDFCFMDVEDNTCATPKAGVSRAPRQPAQNVLGVVDSSEEFSAMVSRLYLCSGVEYDFWDIGSADDPENDIKIDSSHPRLFKAYWTNRTPSYTLLYFSSPDHVYLDALVNSYLAGNFSPSRLLYHSLLAMFDTDPRSGTHRAVLIKEFFY